MPPLAPPLPTSAPRVPRHKVFMPGKMVIGRQTSRIHLLNISLTGALVHGIAPPQEGAVVQLHVDAMQWLARVIWVQRERFGVVHVAPLTSEVVDAMIAPRPAESAL